MSPDTHRPVRVVTFEVDVPRSPAELVDAAAERGADRLELDVWNTADGWAIVNGGPTLECADGSRESIEDVTLRGSDGRPGLHTVEEALLAAHRRRIGLHFRVHERSVVRPLAAAIGVSGGSGHELLRRRFLVVADDAKIGRWLRSEAPELPSAVVLPEAGGGWRGALGRRLPNLARAAADADDLLLPNALAGGPTRIAALARTLARRGGYLWICDLTRAAAEALLSDPQLRGLGGVVERHTL